MSFQTCIALFLLWNTKENIFKNIENQTTLTSTKKKKQHVPQKKRKSYCFGIGMTVSKYWQYFIFGWIILCFRIKRDIILSLCQLQILFHAFNQKPIQKK